MTIPERFRVTCEGCGVDVDATADGVAQFVSGWAVNRPKGTNAVAGQERHRRWLCRVCVGLVRDGANLNQQGLF